MSFWKKLFNSKLSENKKTDSEDKLFHFLEDKLEFQPKNLSIYKEAFVHRSAQKKDENGTSVNFERLEFLGDAVLGMVIAYHLYQEAPNEQEGYLTQMRSKIVSRSQLNKIGEFLDLKSMLESAGNNNFGEDISGDLVEALIGAIYLDKGFKTTAKFINKKILKYYSDLEKLEKAITSHKSLILEWGQKTKNKIRFNTFEEDNAEDLIIFVSVIRMNDKILSKGRGTSKKKAEENASKRAFYILQNRIENCI